MTVDGRIFYHVHNEGIHSRSWKVGKQLIFSGDSNLFYRLKLAEMFRVNDHIKKGKPYLASNNEYFRKVKRFLESDNTDVFDFVFESKSELIRSVNKSIEIQTVLIAYIKLMNEMVFERVRALNFPHLPSRLNCAWITEKRYINKWIKELKGNEKDCKQKIFAVRTYGNVHKTDGSWIKVDLHTPTEISDFATNYWRGVMNPNVKKRLTEYLFTGRILIEEDVTNRYGNGNRGDARNKVVDA